MTAALQTVSTIGRARALRRVESIRGSLRHAADELLAAWRDQDHVDLGYDRSVAGWNAYVRDKFEDLEFRLSAELRRDRVEAMRKAGMAADVIRLIPGMGSKGTVMGDIRALRDAGRLDDADGVTTGADGSRRKARSTAVATQPAPKIGVDRCTAQFVAAAPDGLNVHDLCDKAAKSRAADAKSLRRQGAASASLSRAVKAGLIRHSGTFRDGCTVYVAP